MYNIYKISLHQKSNALLVPFFLLLASDTQRTLREHSENTQGTARDHLEVTQRALRTHLASAVKKAASQKILNIETKCNKIEHCERQTDGREIGVKLHDGSDWQGQLHTHGHCLHLNFS